MNSTCAVVVTYNRIGMLQECVKRLLAQEGAACDILIIDNASTDGTKEKIAPLVDEIQVKYHNTGANLGGAGGFRIGMELAVQQGYEFVWIMDDDSYVYPNSLRELLKANEKLSGEYGFLSSIADWKDGSPCNMNRQRITIKNPIDDYESDLVKIVMATFVSFFIKSEIIRRFGLPIKEFFIWSDDLEYSRRISKELPCYAVNTSHVLHNMASNHKVGIEAEAVDRLWRYEYMYRNEVYLYRREGLKGWCYLFARTGLHCIRVLLNGTEKKKKLGIIFRSFMNGFRFHPEIEYVKNSK